VVALSEGHGGEALIDDLGMMKKECQELVGFFFFFFFLIKLKLFCFEIPRSIDSHALHQDSMRCG
jgi:hypothetical protein